MYIQAIVYGILMVCIALSVGKSLFMVGSRVADKGVHVSERDCSPLLS